jgi:polyphosphate glucokinase
MNVALGFPGECVDGMTIECGNLAKSSGGDGSVDEPVAAMWRDFHLQEQLQKLTRKNVKVVNDALLAALGCVRGVGRELMITLGTGCGVALMIDGVPMKISDFGARPFLGDLTFDEALGESGRSRDEDLWHVNVVEGLNRLSNEFVADRVFVGGGNALRLTPNLELARQEPVTIVRNESALLGASKLFSTA